MNFPPSIGRYDLVRALGQGGMGRVLLARDTVLGRLVAVKILRDDLGLPPEMKTLLFDRMRQEARAAAALSHPNMVTLHDMGDSDASGLFLVFEYIDGPTLRERIADGPLPHAEVARIARELGSALTHAHDAGVIHRDVKPENVMIAATGAKLTDFGIARMPDSTLTGAGSVLGTTAYSAPEALTSADFSALSDQFSLAVTLYEALCGRRAFPGEDALMVARGVALETPPALGFARIDKVFARALEKDKGKRFASCAELGVALASAIEQTPEVPAQQTPLGDTPGPRSSALPRATRRWQNVIAAAAAVVVIAALVVLGKRSDGDGVSLRHVAAAFGSATGVARGAASPQSSPLPGQRGARGSDRPTTNPGATTVSAAASTASAPDAAASSSAAASASAAVSSAHDADDSGAPALTSDAGGAATTIPRDAGTR